MQRLLYYYEGGLGDVILGQTRRNKLTGLAEYTRKHDCYVKVVLNVHNAQAVELLRYQRGINEIELIPYDSSIRLSLLRRLLDEEGYRFARGRVTHETSRRMSFDLSDEDLRYLDKMLPAKPLLLWHPGAGKENFSLIGRRDYRSFLDMAEGKGIAVVLVGGNSYRINDDRYMVEKYMIDHPALVYLMGLANPRLVCEIARRSVGFFGSLSCYVWAAALHKKRGLVVVPDKVNNWYTSRVERIGMHLRRMSEIHDRRLFDVLFEN
jgi:hypothetical protein